MNQSHLLAFSQEEEILFKGDWETRFDFEEEEWLKLRKTLKIDRTIKGEGKKAKLMYRILFRYYFKDDNIIDEQIFTTFKDAIEEFYCIKEMTEKCIKENVFFDGRRYLWKFKETEEGLEIIGKGFDFDF